MQKSTCSFLFLGVIIFLFTLNSYSQLLNVKLENISYKQGLSQLTVTSIIQDRKGFMWFGTQEGINRYDGYSMISYRNDPNNTNSFIGGISFCMFIDKSNNLFIGTDQGLCKYESNINKWTNYKHDPLDKGSIENNFVQSIFEDSEGILWIGTRCGLNKYDKKTGKFTHYLKFFDRSGNPILTHYNSICEDKNHYLWISSNELGLFKLEKKTGKFTRYQHDSKNTNSLSSDYISSICLDDNYLWIFTLDGLDRYNINENKFIHFNIKNRNKEEQRRMGFSPITIDQNKNLWIGSADGLKKIDKSKNRIEDVIVNNSNNLALVNNIIGSLYEDNTGILWIGSIWDGIYKYDIKKHKFASIPNNLLIGKKKHLITFWGIIEVDKSSLWIPTEKDGIIKYNPQTDKYDIYKLKYRNEDVSNILIITKDRNNNLLFGSDDFGFCILKTENMMLSVFGHDPADSTSISSNVISDIFEDKSGFIWIGTRNGLNRFDPKKKTFKRFRIESPDLNLDEINNIYRICEDENNNLWLGSKRGLCKFDKMSEKFTCYVNDPKNSNSLVSGTVYALHYDGKGVLWIGTNSGLDKFEITKEKFTHYSERDGLLNNIISGILEDGSGNLWISTNKGISRFTIKTAVFFNFDESIGVDGNEYNQFSYCKSFDGEMYFGGINGITHFYPDKILSNSIIPPIVITAFRKFDKLFSFDKEISEVKEIELNYDENFFSFEFAALNYSNTEKNQYTYKMEGFDKDWINCGNRRTASYTNLDPGEYIFRVKGSNNDGLWNEEGVSVKVIIRPPFWMTWWFRTSGLLLLIFLGIVAYNTRVQSMKNKAIYLEKQVDERTKQLWEKSEQLFKQTQELSERNKLIEHQNAELVNLKKDLEIKAEQADSANKSKSEFLANMSHEIRTPMNAILGFAEILSDKLKDREYKHYTDTILSSGKALLTIINDILDLSKIEAGKLEFQPSFSDLRKIINEMNQLFNQKMKDKGLDFLIEIDNNLPKWLFLDEIRIRQVIMNLLGNAIKFTESGYVKICAKVEKIDSINKRADIIIIVEDTGIGIPKTQIEKIFLPFEQIDGQSTRKFGGTGLGLSISAKLIKMMGGFIETESEINKGTRFIITLRQVQVMSETEIDRKDETEAKLEIEFEPANILVVDDLSVNRELIKVFLEGYALTVTEVEDGETTLKEVNRHKYDLILLDRKMPGMSGEEVAMHLKQDEKTKHIPVVIFTASALKEEEEKIRNLSDGFLTKPVDKLKLICELKRFLPFKEKEKYDEPQVLQEVEIQDRVITKEEYDELVRLLSEDYYSEWDIVSRTRAMGSVKTFAIKLQQTAVEYGSTVLEKYSADLLEAVTLFKLARVKSILSGYREILEKIKLQI